MTVITEFEIKRFSGQDKVILPAGTIVTPAAKDWANDHNLEIVYDNNSSMIDSTIAVGVGETDKKALLKRVIEIIVAEKRKTGAPIKKEEIAELVITCLKRLGCQV
jgi:ethanolamine utilization cobalamin adenosyltransferase